MTALLTAKELAEHLRVSTREVQRLAARGVVPSFRVGRQLRFSLDEVLGAVRQEQEGAGATRPPIGIADPPVRGGDRRGAAY